MKAVPELSNAQQAGNKQTRLNEKQPPSRGLANAVFARLRNLEQRINKIDEIARQCQRDIWRVEQAAKRARLPEQTNASVEDETFKLLREVMR